MNRRKESPFMKITRQLAVLMAVVGVGVYLSAMPAVAQQAKAKTKAKASAANRPRGFFVQPKNGAMVKSPVHIDFGIQNFKIDAVPPGDIKTARPGVGHYHIGVDQNCLRPGTTIVKGTPSWVHFGDGQNQI